jgi:hypothetical protein
VVGIDHIIEKARAFVNYLTQMIPINRSFWSDKFAQIDRAKITDIIRQEWLFPTRIGGLVLAEVRNRVVLVGPVDEEQTGFAGSMGTLNDEIEDHPGTQGVVG